MSKIKVSSIYTGNIMKVLSNENVLQQVMRMRGISLYCGRPKFESVLFKENALLINVSANGYVEFSSYNELRIKQCILPNGYILDDTIMPATFYPISEEFYIDPLSLKPIAIDTGKDEISISKLNKTLKKRIDFRFK